MEGTLESGKPKEKQSEMLKQRRQGGRLITREELLCGFWKAELGSAGECYRKSISTLTEEDLSPS